MKCPECKSAKVVKCGFALTRKGRVQKYQCTKCARKFTSRSKGGKGGE